MIICTIDKQPEKHCSSQIETQYTLQRRRSWRGLPLSSSGVSRDYTRKYTIKSVRFCKFQRFQISKSQRFHVSDLHFKLVADPSQEIVV